MTPKEHSRRALIQDNARLNSTRSVLRARWTRSSAGALPAISVRHFGFQPRCHSACSAHTREETAPQKMHFRQSEDLSAGIARLWCHAYGVFHTMTPICPM